MNSDSQGVDSADVAIVGGGPAGLMAAIAAAESGATAIVLEQLERPGAKLLASGGGRCNLTNTLPAREFMDRFGRQGRFMQPALEVMGSGALRRFFEALGVPTDAPDGFHVYPTSNSAAAVQSALWRRTKELGATVRLGATVTGLWIEDGSLRGIQTHDGRVAAKRVVLATGGRGYPSLGGAETGYSLARQAGHTLVTPVPALVPLVVRETHLQRCAGVAISPARIWIDLPRQAKAGETGDVMLTHTGLSGPARRRRRSGWAASTAGKRPPV
jgi:predicted Rossmann fold flavoprotein